MIFKEVWEFLINFRVDVCLKFSFWVFEGERGIFMMEGSNEEKNLTNQNCYTLPLSSQTGY